MSKRFSIKAKITLWYMFLITSIVIAFFGIIFYISDSFTKNGVHEYLKSHIDESFNFLVYENGELEVKKDLETFAGFIKISILNNDREFIYGEYPLTQKYDEERAKKEVIVVKEQNKKWYVYEQKRNYEEYGDIWIRGVIESSFLENFLDLILRLTIFGAPFFLILATISGYSIAKNAFKPIERITNAAREINDGNDLTKRINLGEGKDEIYNLANTFDNMFDKLQASFDSEVQFTSDVSHELRTPITVIMSQAEFGKEYITDIDSAKQGFDVILKESQKMSTIVSELLTLARMDKGQHPLNIEEVNISEIIEITVETLINKSSKKNITISYDLDYSIYLKVDENMMSRAFINLISNAITYGRQNGFIKISLHKDIYNNLVIIKIEDNGIGIAKENIDKIWTRFFQEDTSRTTDNSGLGLSMVKWIIEAHRGIITVSSEQDKGTTFTIILPFNN